MLRHYDTAAEPGERLLVRCRNRRATVCPACSRLHAGDTYHLVRAGLLGGKSVPAEIREHPRLFVTFTAPSFGPVHRANDGRPCRPRRSAGTCEHGRSRTCQSIHAEGDLLVGQPFCPDCYDYVGHVLWHTHAGRLWKAFTDNLYNHLATRAGRTRNALRRSLRISYAKVAEYQQRGAIHLHAVIRLDGACGPDSEPPAWVGPDMLAEVIRTAAAAVHLRTPYSAALGEHGLAWGTQLDVRPLRSLDDPNELADEAVAAYVAKYVTKGAAEGSASGTDRRVTSVDDIDHAPVTPHVRSLMRACWRLGGISELRSLRLRAWAHTLGYRGHILTKSRRYSTTYAALRAERAAYRQPEASAEERDTTVEVHWRYVGSGHSPGAALIAAGIAEDLARNREIARDDALARGDAG